MNEKNKEIVAVPLVIPVNFSKTTFGFKENFINPMTQHLKHPGVFA